MARVLVLALGQAPNGSARSRAHGRQPAVPSCPGQGEALTVCKGTDNFRHEVRFAPTICRNRLKNMHAPARAPTACALQGSAAGCCPWPHVCFPPILQKIGNLTFRTPCVRSREINEQQRGRIFLMTSTPLSRAPFNIPYSEDPSCCRCGRNIPFGQTPRSQGSGSRPQGVACGCLPGAWRSCSPAPCPSRWHRS